MAVRQRSIPVYKETPITLAANGTFTLFRTCDLVAIIELVGTLEMSINDAEFSTIRGGIIFTMPNALEGEDVMKITKLTFRETASAPANLVIATADGNVQDNRASFAGNLPVVNAAAPNESVQVDLIAADPGLVALAASINANIDVEVQAQTASINSNIDTELAAVITALQASNSLRNRYTSLASATQVDHSNTGGEIDVVSAAANTNGILVKIASCHTHDDDLVCYYSAGTGNPFVGLGLALSGGVQPTVYDIRDVHIPAGTALRVNSAANTSAFIWYQVL